ncbi:MAG: hypothetical protein ACKOEC_21585, partial [Acidimicrobiia bacterium]
MFGQLLTKIVGTQNDRELKRLKPRVVEVNAFEPAIKALSDEQLKPLQAMSLDVALDPLRIALLSSTILGDGDSLASRDGFLLADLV